MDIYVVLVVVEGRVGRGEPSVQLDSWMTTTTTARQRLFDEMEWWMK